MANKNEALGIAWKYYREGDYTRSERLGRQLRQAYASDPDILFFLGVVLQRVAKHEEAAECFNEAVQYRSKFPEAFNNLGNALAAMHRFEEAEPSYQKALKVNPKYAEAHNNLGNTLRSLGKQEEAIASFERAILLKRDYPEAHNNLGNALRAEQRFDEAVASFRRALQYKPDYPEASNNLGIVFATLEQYDQAIASFEHALKLRPGYVDACGNLGVVLLESGHVDQSIDVLIRALGLAPDVPNTHYQLAQAYSQQGKFDKSIRHYHNALRLAPGYTEALEGLGTAYARVGNLNQSLECFANVVKMLPNSITAHVDHGLAFKRLGRMDEAVAAFDCALRRDNNNTLAHVHRAEALLALGRFKEGWSEYEWRSRNGDDAEFDDDQLRWKGEPLVERTILIRAETSEEDVIQFVRYATMLKQQGGVVVLQIPKDLAPLLRTCLTVDQVVDASDAQPPVDTYVDLMSLPAILGTSLHNVSSDVPYLRADPEQVKTWKDILGAAGQLKIGILWRHNVNRENAQPESISLIHFLGLARMPGVKIFSLQTGQAASVLEQLGEGIGVVNLGPRIADDSTGWLDKAAILENLDLLIACDSPTAHLAGALGRPVWIPLPVVGDWRWMLDREDVPWYPTMRLFRQKTSGQWDNVFARIHKALLQMVPDDVPEQQHDCIADAQTFNDMGVSLAETGKPHEAIMWYRQALQLQPDYPEAHNNLGNAIRNLGDVEGAIQHYLSALRARGEYAPAHNNLGIALANQGKRSEALAHFEKALEIDPKYSHACSNAGVAHLEEGNLDAALEYFQRTIEIAPRFAKAHINLGNTLARQNKPEKAKAAFIKAVEVDPSSAEAHRLLANMLRDLNEFDAALESYENALRLFPDSSDVYNHMGILFARQQNYNVAIKYYRQALRLNPEYTDAHNNLGIALSKAGRASEAIASYRQALRIRPDYAEAHSNLGIALTEQWRHEEAILCFEEALRHKPDYAAAYSNLGIALTELRRVDEALWNYEKAIELDPNYADAHMNYALSLLSLGRLEEGWEEYEWRWRCNNINMAPFEQPLWEGEPLDGRTIVLHFEQGLGDTIQFVRYASQVKEQGGHVVLMCQKPLLKLLARTPGIDELVPREDDLPECDVHVPLMSLPRIFETTMSTIPAETPYVFPEEKLAEKWRHYLRGFPEFKIGISWQGNPRYGGDKHRSVPLFYFAPLARVDGVRLFSLQKNHGSEQREDVREMFPLVDLSGKLDVESGAFMDTAAVMVNLDLMITSDTAIAHVAGALGIPVWVPLPCASDWRWFRDRDDSPWYPNMRLFFQREFGNWSEVFDRMEQALRETVEQNARRRPVTVEIAPGELFDKITILEIKETEISDAAKLKNVHHELRELRAARDWAVEVSAELDEAVDELRAINRQLWEIEDRIRLCEKNQDFGEQFVELARSVYITNDRRSDVKRKINTLLGSVMIEEKNYEDYAEPSDWG